MRDVVAASVIPAGLARFAGFAAIGAGALRIAAAAIPYVPESIWLEALYGLIDIGFLFATVGLSLAVWPRIDWLGVVGAGVLVAGIASIVGPDAVFHGMSMYQAGLGVIALGSVAFALSLLRLGVFTATGWAWIAAAGLGIGATLAASPLLFAIAGASFGLAYVTAGLRLLRR